MRNTKHILFIVMTCFTLVSLQSCEWFEEEEYKPQVPYYQFTAEDKLWLNYKLGDTLLFENSAGKQHFYIINEIKEEIKRKNFKGTIGCSSCSDPIKYYFDRFEVRFKRLDTLYYNTIDFRRTIPKGVNDNNAPVGNGEFMVSGIWQSYIGDHAIDAPFTNLTILPSQLQLQNSQTLVVRGRIYNNVITISTKNYGVVLYYKPYINIVYYDQQSGIIRMISKTGEVWDRLP